jgi:hypothetical protein
MPFLLSGWGNLEKDPNGRLFRWAEGMTVRFFVPVVRQRPARLQLDLERFPLLASQSVAIEVDGVEIASAVIPRGASFHDFDVSRVTWTVGGHVVTLRFSAAGRPEGATDQRLLAAVLRSVRLR